MFEEARFNFSLASDNHSGVHPKVMRAIQDCNRGSAHAYGLDEVCEAMNGEVRRVFGPAAEAHLVFNGTAANVLALAGATDQRPGGVICSDVAHVHLDEGGAPEFVLGSKLWTIPSVDGRAVPGAAEPIFARAGDQHFAQPRAVTLTQPTELGTSYTIAELRAWGQFCRAKNLMFHLDGARLANAAAHLGCDLADLTTDVGVDALSFGGTKNGLLGAEAVILFDEQLKRDFRYRRKRAMQLPSKTRYMAAQIYAYLEGDLWREIANHVCAEARDLAARLPAGVRLVHPVESNALFVQLPPGWLEPLRDFAFFYVWDRPRALVRWMISWDFTRADADRLIARMRELERADELARPLTPAERNA